MPVRDAHRQLIGAVAIFRDLTRERELLSELAANAADNAYLTRELANRGQRLQYHIRVLVPPDPAGARQTGAALSGREHQVQALNGWVTFGQGHTHVAARPASSAPNRLADDAGASEVESALGR